MIIIMLGPPGAGKGTQASAISRKYSIPHIATGDLFRDEIARGTELGRRIEHYVKSGALVPDELVNEVVRRRIAMQDCKNGFILDGYPRTLAQVKALDEILGELGLKVDLVLNLSVSDEAVIKRLSYRRICAKCGRIYHLIFNPPRVDEVCDECGEKLYQRDDDREEVVKRRLRVYYESTEPLVEHYRRRGVLVEVDANGEIEEVEKRIDEVLRSYLSSRRALER